MGVINDRLLEPGHETRPLFEYPYIPGVRGLVRDRGGAGALQISALGGRGEKLAAMVFPKGGGGP